MSTSPSPRLWILGASDPEMEQIARLLTECGEPVTYATMPDGSRVRPEQAYRCLAPTVPAGTTVYAVECLDRLPTGGVRIDHHRPGDPGYGRPPREFLEASSIGQVIAELARLGRLPSWQRGQLSAGTPGRWVLRGYRGTWAVAEAAEYPRHYRAVYVPFDIILVAAADHCLGAAYRGECPGVDPDALMRWRVESRARFGGRSVEEVLADIERARETLRGAPTIALGECQCVRDLRAQLVPELPDAASRDGEAYLALVTVDGSGRPCRPKIVLGGCTTPEMVRAFLEHWAPQQGLVDCYGDPSRGFAGGYLAARPSALA